MTIFEDLLDELKEENLLEETSVSKDDQKEDPAHTESDQQSSDEVVAEEVVPQDETEPIEAEEIIAPTAEESPAAESKDPEEYSEIEPPTAEYIDLGETQTVPEEESPAVATETEESDVDDSDSEESIEVDEVAADKEIIDESEEEMLDPVDEEKEAYLQRVVESVKSLQHVEHIISGVEREQMRERPNSYDPFSVKQALHKFFEAFDEAEAGEKTPAEVELLKETEAWHSALLERDKKVSVAHLRRFCETTKPRLSSQGLVSMARFYRNSPFSEEVRAKFDLIVTRLFSKEIKGDKREVVFERDELIKHVKELYADWASVPLYEEDEENSEIVLAAFKFQDYVAEANKVKDFDELIKKGFFKRLKSFKRKTEENFFAPLLIAAAVESNVAIGNRYVELISAERKKVDTKSIGEKYGELHDSSVSEATSKSLELVELLDNKAEAVSEKVRAHSSIGGKLKWIIAAVAGVLVLAFAAYMFGLFGGSEKKVLDLQTQDGSTLNLENSSFKDYLTSASIHNETLIGTVKATWGKLPFKKKEEIVGKIQAAGKDRGYSKVELTNPAGKSVAFSSEGSINVVR